MQSERVPAALAELNWIGLDGSTSFAADVERLHEALRTDLDRRRLHTKLLVKAQDWEGHDRDQSRLLRGSELKTAEDWLAAESNGPPVPLPVQTRFIVASRRASASRLRALGATAVAVLAALTVLAVIAFVQRNDAVQQRNIAEQQRNIAVQQQRRVTAQLLLTQARATVSVDPRTALRFAEAADVLGPTPETGDTLVQLLGDTRSLSVLTGLTNPVPALAFAPDGHTLAAGDNTGTIALWDVRSPTNPRQLEAPLTSHTGPVNSVAFSPDGHSLATGSADGWVVLWDVRNPAGPRQLGQPFSSHTGFVGEVAFAPDGHVLAEGGNGGAVAFWDVQDPTRPRQLGPPLVGQTGDVSHGLRA